MKTFLILLLSISPVLCLGGERSSFLEKILADGDPTAFSPAPFEAEDFRVESTQALEKQNFSARLLPGSLQWVRVDELLVAPRALLEVQGDPSMPGVLETSGFSQPLVNGRARILVPLLSGNQNRIELITAKGRHSLLLQFRPRIAGPRVFFDHSCSRVQLSLKQSTIPNNAWAYIGCRYVRNQSNGIFRNDLDLLLLADNLDELQINGIGISPIDVGRWNLRLTSSNQTVEIISPKGGLDLEVRLPEKAHRAFLGLGVGPYAFKYEEGQEIDRSTVPLTTIYSAYTLTNSHRIVFFAAFAPQKNLYTDAGLYFQFESFRAFDRRISMNLLLGAHGYLYKTNRISSARMNFPQGFEFFFFDLLGRGKNASFGGFVQPPISEKSYYNLWLRWGPPSWFLEANYISLSEPNFLIQTYGLSIGFPFIKFL